jgi:hypothetical protein
MAAPKVGRRRPAPAAHTENATAQIEAPTAAEAHAEKAKPDPYPRRVTLDLSDDMYDRLRAEAFRTHKPLSVLGREALDQYLPQN